MFQPVTKHLNENQRKFKVKNIYISGTFLTLISLNRQGDLGF